MIQFIAELRQDIHQLLGLAGYACVGIGMLMLLFSVVGGRIQGEKITRAVIIVVAGAVLMNFVQAYL